MKKFGRVTAILLLIAIATTLVPLEARASGTVAWGAANVTANGVRVRSEPSLSGNVLTHASQGDAVVLLSRENSEWYRVSFNGNVGYMSVPLLERPRTRANFEAQGRITGASVNLRAEPNTTSSVLTSASQGTVMNILGINEGWFKVSHNGHIAYVRSDLMETVARGTNSTAASSNQRGRVTGSSVNLRSGPSTTRSIVGATRAGAVMEILTSTSGWFRVSYGGRTAYIRGDLMEIVPSSTPLTTPTPSMTVGQQISALASSLVGTPYVWGGASRSGFDCSGFVTYVLRQFDIRVSRTASAQFRDNGTPVSRENLAPGDLVFFARDGANISHVGIYIGNDQFVHASGHVGAAGNRYGVITSRLSARTLHGARRVI